MREMEIVHPDDRWMVREKDVLRIFKLGPDVVQKTIDQDEAYRLSLFMHYLDKGLDAANAARQVRLTYPIYYLDPKNRTHDKMDCENDANLPIASKNRLKPLKLVKVKKNMNDNHTSFNACVRELIKNDKL